MPETSRESLKLPITASLALHALLLGALIWFGMSRLGPVVGGSGEQAQRETTPEEDKQQAIDDIAARVNRGIAEASQRDPMVNISSASEGADWLEAHSTTQRVGAAADVVARQYGKPSRAYAPVEPPPPGRFDMNSMLPYKSERIVGDDGLARTHQTWVDAEGRAMTQTKRRIVDDAGETWVMQGVFQPDGSLFETKMPDTGGAFDSALEIGSRSEILHELFTRGVLPVLESKRQDDALREGRSDRR